MNSRSRSGIGPIAQARIAIPAGPVASRGGGDRGRRAPESLRLPEVVVATESALGNASLEDLVDVVYVRPTDSIRRGTAPSPRRSSG